MCWGRGRAPSPVFWEQPAQGRDPSSPLSVGPQLITTSDPDKRHTDPPQKSHAASCWPPGVILKLQTSYVTAGGRGTVQVPLFHGPPPPTPRRPALGCHSSSPHDSGAGPRTHLDTRQRRLLHLFASHHSEASLFSRGPSKVTDCRGHSYFRSPKAGTVTLCHYPHEPSLLRSVSTAQAHQLCPLLWTQQESPFEATSCHRKSVCLGWHDSLGTLSSPYWHLSL